MSDYDVVSKVIGEHMQAAWVDIMQKLADSVDTSNITTASGTTLTANALAGFFGQLGTANLLVSFGPVTPQPRQEASNNTSIQLSTELTTKIKGDGLAALGFSGTITVGATFGF